MHSQTNNSAQLSSETLIAHLDAIISDALAVKKQLGSRPARQLISQHIKKSQKTTRQLIVCNKKYYEQLCDKARQNEKI